MIGYPSGFHWALIGLFLFGIVYAMLVRWLGDRHDGYTWLLVTVGVSVTLLVSDLYAGQLSTVHLFLLFAASGTPMAAENIISAVIRRNRMSRAVNEQLSKLADWGISMAGEVNDDDPAQAPR